MIRFYKGRVPAAKIFLSLQISLSAKNISSIFESGVGYK